MPAITLPLSYASPADESPERIFWQHLAAEEASYARLAYIDGDYENALRSQHLAARCAAIARKEYLRWIAARQ